MWEDGERVASLEGSHVGAGMTVWQPGQRGQSAQGDSACPPLARGSGGAVLAALPHCCLLNGGVSRRTGGGFSVRKVVEWRSFRWGVEYVLLDSLRPSLPVIFLVSHPRVHRGWP